MDTVLHKLSTINYYCTFPYSRDLESRQRMDRRRLEEAFLQYALLRVASWYPSDIGIEELHMHDGLSQTLLSATPLFHKAFIQKYAGVPHFVGHRCDIPGCGEVLVLDGNMKNNREVCFATEAGYAEFSGLPGQIRTGCPNTPAIKSRYCSVHAPITVIPQEVQFSEDGNPVTVNATTSTEVRHAAIIASKRVTRSSTFYQVITVVLGDSRECVLCWFNYRTSVAFKRGLSLVHGQ